MITNFREHQDFYCILYSEYQMIFQIQVNNSDKNISNIHYNPLITLPLNLRQIWNTKKEMWFSHEYIENWNMEQKIYNNDIEDNISLILQYDQLSRHPTKQFNQFTNEKYKKLNFRFATQLSFQMIHNGQYDLLNENEKVFLLLCIRHNQNLKLKMFVLSKIYKELERTTQHSIWFRFLNATIMDIDSFKYKNNMIKESILHNEPINYLQSAIEVIQKPNKIIIPSNFETIYTQFILEWGEKFESLVLNYIHTNWKIAISISGGVDSMVASYILKRICIKHDIEMIMLHISYNNRDCCDKERNLLYYWAKHLNVPLFIREIDEIKRSRSTQFRALYEDVTRKLRFNFYKYFNCPIILGHNKDDTIENMFSNLSKRIHFDNLKGMNEHSIESDIDILRPFLSIEKKNIVMFADYLDIPHLVDSTPVWSRRGKTRDILMPAIDKFDSQILPGLHEYTEYTSFLYEQWNLSFKTWVSNSNINFNNDKTNIIINRDLFFNTNYMNSMFWIKLWFELNLPTRPSNKSIKNVIECIQKEKTIKCTLNKQFNILITIKNIVISKV